MNIILPPAYDNESAHHQVKQLMEQKKNLSIRVDDTPCAWISNSDMSRLKYMLNTASWNWIINPNRSLEKVSCHFLMPAIKKTALYMLDL